MFPLALLKVVPIRVWIIAGVVLALLGYHWWTVSSARDEGRQEAQTETLNETKRRLDNALGAESRARDELPRDGGVLNDPYRRD